MIIAPASKKARSYFRESATIIAIVFGLYLYLSLGSFSTVADAKNIGGQLGNKIAFGLLYMFGYSSYLIIVLLVYAISQLIWQITNKEPLSNVISSLIGLLLVIISTCGLEALRLYTSASSLPHDRSGGIIGFGVAKTLYDLIGFHGGSLILLGMWFSSLSLFAMFSWLEFCNWIGVQLTWVWRLTTPLMKSLSKLAVVAKNLDEVPSARKSRPVKSKGRVLRRQQQEPKLKNQVSRAKPAIACTKEPDLAEEAASTASQSSYALPPTELLTPPPANEHELSATELQQMAMLIQEKLGEFGVDASVGQPLPGPVVTRYEIQPATGVKGSQVVNLVSDLSRALSVASIRVLETIPGKTTMGLEVPNVSRQVVSLQEVLSSEEYQNVDSSLPLALGRDISGNVFVANLAEMPHLLVAGTTGAGKSVQINAMILSLLYRASPDHVRLILIDPKVVELAPFDDLPHLLAPVITNMDQVPLVLTWCVAEMERRYQLMAHMGVRNLVGLNAAIAKNPLNPETDEELKPLHLLVVVVDELADLMAVAGKKVEQLISRLAQKARAAGIHLILATQRPSVDVITGLIKANIPSRIAFQVSSRIDSRTILDQGGAETLLGKGDMLYLPSGLPQPIRVHGAFVSNDEVRAVCAHIKQCNAPTEKIDFAPKPGTGGLGGLSLDDDATDPMLQQAIDLVTTNQRVSISLVQRHLRIGYNRAARLVESMERTGIVSTMDTGGNRKLLTLNKSDAFDK